MKLYIMMFFFSGACMMGCAQDITGEYSMEGKQEMVSVIRINPDSTFNFYFAYGAADRYANGYWTVSGRKIILNTPEKTEQDFILVESRHTSSKKITVQITDANKQVLPFVSILLKGKNTELYAKANGEGEAVFSNADADTIYLQHEIWTNEPVAFALKDKTKNFFEFRINPDIVNVVFKDIILTAGDNELTGSHPLMQGEFHYVKN
jgi:hypothetical protein